MLHNTSLKKKVNEKPILFTSEMVRALLQGRKKQTRRIAKNFKVLLKKPVSSDFPFNKIVAKVGIHKATLNKFGAVSITVGNEKLGVKPGEFEWVCPLGNIGDNLWVRENFAYVSCEENEEGAMPWGTHDIYPLVDYGATHYSIRYAATEDSMNWDSGWRPSIHMPRWASRINLQITNIRLERLQEISPFECHQEGFNGPLGASDEPGFPHGQKGVLQNFINAWNCIYENWDSNPWVWVIEFRVVGV